MPIVVCIKSLHFLPSDFFPIADFWLRFLPASCVPLLKHLVSLFSSASCTRLYMCILNVYVGHRVCVCYLPGCLCATDVSGVFRDQMPWQWSYSPLWAAVWVLSIKPGSPRRARNALKCSIHIVYDSSEFIPLTQLSGCIYLAKTFIFFLSWILFLSLGTVL